MGCDRQPCEVEASKTGPHVRFDVALETCNAKPVATISVSTVQVPKSTVVRLDASRSVDPNGDPLTFRWELKSIPPGSGAVLSSASGKVTTFTPDLAGPYQVSLVAEDGELQSNPRVIAVLAENTAPLADAGGDAMAALGEEVQLDGSGSSDPDGDDLSHSWSIVSAPITSAATLVDEGSARPRILVDARGRYEFELTVSDGEAVATDRMLLSVGISANPPTARAGPNASADLGEVVALDGSASSDPDGDALTYDWTMTTSPPGNTAALSDATAARPTFRPNVPGRFIFELVVSDGFYTSLPSRITVDVVHTHLGPSTFDPMVVNVIGTYNELSEGSESLVCSISEPDLVGAGFDSAVTRAMVRPADGKLLYIDTNLPIEVREYNPDRILFIPEQAGFVYPLGSRLNDVVIPTPPCIGADFRRAVSDFIIDPRTGGIVYACVNDHATWYRDGQHLITCPTDDHDLQPGHLLAVGHDGAIYCNRAVRDPQGIMHPYTATEGIIIEYLAPARAVETGGIWVPAYARDSTSRVHIDSTGRLTVDLAFGPMPEPYVPIGSHLRAVTAVDGHGSVWRYVSDPTNPNIIDSIALFSSTATASIPYTEQRTRLCKLDQGWLFTGP